MTSLSSHPWTFSGENLTFDIQNVDNTFNWATNFTLTGNSQTASVFTKIGRGTVVITTAQTYSNDGLGLGPATSVNGGVLKVDTSAGGSLKAVAVNANNRIFLSGGTFYYLGKGGANSVSQNVGNIKLNTFGGTIVVDNNGGDSGTATTLNLGDFKTLAVLAGSSVNLRTINAGAGSSVMTTTETNTNGIIGAGRLTYNETSFATNSTNVAGGAVGSYTGATSGIGDATTATTVNYKQSGSGAIAADTFAGTLQIGSALGSGQTIDLGTKILTINTGGLLVTGSDNYAINNGTIKSATATASDLIIHDYGTGTLTIGAVIANDIGTSTLTKTGSGTLILTGTNTFTGQTYINGGTLSIGANANLSSSALNINGGTFAVTSSFTNSRAVTIGGNGATFDVGAGLTQQMNNVISGVNGQLILINTGTLQLNVANTFGGGVLINNGILKLNGANSLNSAGINPLAFGPGSAPKLTMNGFGANVVELTSANTAAVVENGGAAAVVLGVNNGNANTYAGVLQNGGAGTLGLTKGGRGVLTLSAANTYTGPTNVYNGTLNLIGSLAIGSSVTVASSGVLGGTGTAGGSVAIANGGTLAPGSGVGTLTTGALTFSGGKFTVEVNNASNNPSDTADKLSSSGPVDLGSGVATLDLSFLGGATGSYSQSFTIIDNTTASTTTGYFAGLQPVSGTSFAYSSGGLSYTIDYAAGTGNDVSLAFSTVPVPEPTSLTVIGLGAGAMLRRRRRSCTAA